MSKKIVIANWKMNPLTAKAAEKYWKDILIRLPRIKNTEIVICAPFLFLERLRGRGTRIALGAQNSFAGDVGPFTGEVSAEMLYEIGVRYVILGHSERRNPPAGGGESDKLINKKVRSAVASSLTPILCIGEKERDGGHGYLNVVKNQLIECLEGVERRSFSKIIVAYEPVWAISSTQNRRDATPAESREMTVFIRKVLSDLSTPEIASKMRIIYGGSVDEDDAGEFLEHGGVDGVLVGRASLDPQKFAEIVHLADSIKE